MGLVRSFKYFSVGGTWQVAGSVVGNEIINVITVQFEKDLTHPEWEFRLFYYARESH